MVKARQRRNSGNVTISDVASLAGVGTMTVSRALRTPKAVSEKLREKIQQAIEELGYIPNQAAGALASGQAKSIAIIVSSLKDKFYTQFLPRFQANLNNHGYQIQLSYNHSSVEKEEQLVESALGTRPSAIVIFGQQHTQKSYQLLDKATCPTLQISSSTEAEFLLNIGVNHFELTLEATQHLLNSGKKNIGFIGARNDNLTLQQQVKGWQSAMIKAYHSPDHFLTNDKTPDIALGIEGLNRLLLRDSSLDALICSHEDIALGVLFECQRRLIKMPDDMKILCLDGGQICRYSHPKITAIEINYSALAQAATELLLSNITKMAINLNTKKFYKLVNI